MAVDILIVGEAPSRNPEAARSKQKMARFLGVPPSALAYGIPASSGGIAWLNLFFRPQPKIWNGKGSEFDQASARIAASELKAVVNNMPRSSRPQAIMLLGKRVGEAWTQRQLEELKFFKTVNPACDPARSPAIGVDAIPTYLVPHPSGVNRFWNDPANVTKAFLFYRRIRKQIFAWRAEPTKRGPTSSSARHRFRRSL